MRWSAASPAPGSRALRWADTPWWASINSLLFQVVLPLLLSPAIAFAGAYLLVWPATWAARYTPPSVVNSRSRRAQSVAAGAVAFGHGLQDGQRTSAV